MLSIGQFSRACQVTIKTLHHYDKLELVKPAFIDAQSGYRYYKAEQIPHLLLIQRLKRYGFSLIDIQQLLSIEQKETLLLKLSAQKAILHEQLRETNIILHELEDHLSDFERTGNIMSYQNNYQIALKETTAMPIISTKQQMGVDEFGYYYGKLFEQIGQKHLTVAGPLMAIYHDKEFHADSSVIELAAPIAQEQAATRILPGGLCATTIHHGAYSALSDAYGALVKWIADNNYEMTEAPFDIYLKSHHDQLPIEQWETEICFPVKKKD